MDQQDTRIELSKNKITEAALEWMLADGMDALSIDGLVKRSGVAKTTIYRHFESINDILADTIIKTLPKQKSVDTGSIITDMELLLGYTRQSFESATWGKLLADIVKKTIQDEEFRKIKGKHMAQMMDPMRVAIKRSIDRGEINPDIPTENVIVHMIGPCYYAHFECPDLYRTKKDIDLIVHNSLSEYLVNNQ